MAKAVILGTAHPHIFGIAASAKKVAGLELAGVYDEDATRRAASAQKLGVPAIDTLEQALSLGAKVALIGAVPSGRAALAAAASRAGAAVLVDKPLAVTFDALEKVKQAVASGGKPVIVYYPYRGHAQVLAARAALKAGRIGKLVRVFSSGPHKLNAPNRPDWHWSRQHNGSLLIDIGSHHVDLCCWLAEGDPNYIAAVQGNFSQPGHPEFRDFGQAQLRFPNGVLAHVEVDWLNPVSMKYFGDTRVWLQGTEGKIELRMGDEVSATIWTPTAAAQPLDVSAYQSVDHWDEQLIRDLMEGNPTSITQDEVWRASKVTLLADASAEAGGRAWTG